MNILEIKFNEVPENAFGIVITGCDLGSDLGSEDACIGWVNGVTNHLKQAGVVLDVASELPPLELWEDIRQANTTGGRTDLIFIGDPARFNVGMFAMARLGMGSCSWIEDWLVNYAEHYGSAKRGPHASSRLDGSMDFDESD